MYVVEGEKDADTLTALGVVATTNPHGAGKWDKVPDAPDVLTGATVVVVADADESGRQRARDVAGSLVGKAQQSPWRSPTSPTTCPTTSAPATSSRTSR